MPTSARNCFIMFSYLDDKWFASDGRVSIWSRFLINSRPKLADLLPPQGWGDGKRGIEEEKEKKNNHYTALGLCIRKG